MTTPLRRTAAPILAFLSSRALLALLGVVLLVVSLYFWKAQARRELAQIAIDVQSKARSYASETESRYDRVYGALTRLASRGAPRGAVAIAEWQKDAAFYLDTFRGIKRVAWVDDAFYVRQVVPLEDNDVYLNNLATYVELEPLEVNLWLPTYDDVNFRGFILATISLVELIAPVVEEIGAAYMLQLTDDSSITFTSDAWLQPQVESIATRAVTLKNNAVVNLALAPTTELLNTGTRGARNTLWFALLLSFLTVGAAAAAQNYLRQARSSDLRYQSLFKSSRDAIFVTNAAGQFQDANLAATTMVGFALVELQQMTIADLLAPHDTGPQEPLPTTWLAGVSIETHFLHKEGRAIPVELGAAPIGAAGLPQFMVVIARDITARKLAEAELIQYRDHLEALVAERTRALQVANAELESFSVSVSHDLRTPLRHIDGFVQLLDKRLGEHLDPTSQRYLKNVIDASQRMGQLIDDLLKFSRTSRSEMARSVVDPAILVEQARGELLPPAGSRQITWNIGPLPKVMADPSLLRVVWTNLVSNAVKFTGKCECAVIEIGVVPAPCANGVATFFIRDNGVGFDPAYASRLFGVFQRLHQEDEFAGTGIGLATVRRIVQRHGGEIWAEAVEGEGATFYFTLQLAPQAARLTA